jgi:hypothetical protein
MKSHTCEFTLGDLARLTVLPLVPVALFALAMHLGAALQFLPPPRPALDTDRTILIHQGEAARAAHDAEILLFGDSSCLMDVSAHRLTEQLGRPVLNLGTLSYLDLNAHALLLHEYTQANPGRVRAVVLLMNSEALRRLDSEPYYFKVLTNFWKGFDSCSATNWEGEVCCLLGAEILKARCLARVLPIPLGGAFGRSYGFTRDLEKFMTREGGSVIDPGSEPLKGNAEYRLSPTLERASRAFKAAVPAGAKLFVAITPVPERFAGPRYPPRHAELLRQWAEWLQADAALVELPPALPDDSFTRVTHLKGSAVPRYTAQLADALKKQLK